MDVRVSLAELVAAFERDWPREFELTSLRLLNRKQAAAIDELESRPGSDDQDETAQESGEGARGDV